VLGYTIKDELFNDHLKGGKRKFAKKPGRIDGREERD